MKQTTKTDISEQQEIKFEGDTLKLEKCLDKEKHTYLFARYNHNGRLYGYELVKGVKTKNPDGNYIYRYPSSSQFGTYGFFIAERFAETDIPRYLAKLQKRGQKS